MDRVRVYHASPEMFRETSAFGMLPRISKQYIVNLFQRSAEAMSGAPYVLAAVVETGDRQTAYRLTNNIDRAWPENEGVACHTRFPRSTSVGDVLVIMPDGCDWTAYICAPAGWEEAPEIAEHARWMSDR